MDIKKQLIILIISFQILNTYSQEIKRCYEHTNGTKIDFIEYRLTQYKNLDYISMGQIITQLEQPQIDKKDNYSYIGDKSVIGINIIESVIQLNNNFQVEFYQKTQELIYPYDEKDNITDRYFYDFYSSKNDSLKIKETSFEKDYPKDKTFKERKISSRYIPTLGLIPQVENLSKNDDFNPKNIYKIENLKGPMYEPNNGRFIKFKYKVKLNGELLTPIEFVIDETEKNVEFHQNNDYSTDIEFEDLNNYTGDFLILFLLNKDHNVVGFLVNDHTSALYKLKYANRKCNKKSYLTKAKEFIEKYSED